MELGTPPSQGSSAAAVRRQSYTAHHRGSVYGVAHKVALVEVHILTARVESGDYDRSGKCLVGKGPTLASGTDEKSSYIGNELGSVKSKPSYAGERALERQRRSCP